MFSRFLIFFIIIFCISSISHGYVIEKNSSAWRPGYILYTFHDIKLITASRRRNNFLVYFSTTREFNFLWIPPSPGVSDFFGNFHTPEFPKISELPHS